MSSATGRYRRAYSPLGAPHRGTAVEAESNAVKNAFPPRGLARGSFERLPVEHLSKFFETHTTRGVRLSPTDLLKCHLFSVVHRDGGSIQRTATGRSIGSQSDNVGWQDKRPPIWQIAQLGGPAQIALATPLLHGLFIYLRIYQCPGRRDPPAPGPAGVAAVP